MIAPGARRGATLAVVLWVLVALGALAFAVGVAARLDLALTTAWEDHAAALGLAEAGVADALSAIALEGRAAGALEGGLATGTYRAAWEPAGAGTRILATGVRGGSERTVEARAVADAYGGLHIAAWREVR